MKIVIAICVFFISVNSVEVFSQQKQVGKIYKLDPRTGEVIISAPRAAEIFKLGDKLMVMAGQDRIILTVNFPMMTIARCTIDSKQRSLTGRLIKNTPVYVFSEQEIRLVKKYKNYDLPYINTYRKVRFINELSDETALTADLYFIVTYDKAGAIIETIEMTNHIKTAVDYYHEDRIIKKELFNAQTKMLRKVSVYDYYPNGFLKRAAHVDYEKNIQNMEEWDDKGNTIKSDSAGA